MKKYMLLMLGCVVLCGCDQKAEDGDIIIRHCGNYDVEMSFSEEGSKMHAILNGDAVDMEIAVSASGARYVGVLNDTDVILWGRGDDWTLFLNDDAPIECTIK